MLLYLVSVSLHERMAPTFVTMAPAPAATTAALVDTLNVSNPSPPVPTISQVGPTPSKPRIWTEWERITVAAAAMYADCSSNFVSFKAVRKAAICAAVCASGLTMCSNAAAMSSSLKFAVSVVSFFNRGLNDSGVRSLLDILGLVVAADKEEIRAWID